MSSNPLSPNYEMATVLFMDIVGYSLRTIDRQTELLGLLQGIVKQSASFQQARSQDELIIIPTGDGMALAFLRNPELPVKCALEIAGALRTHPEITLRMGVHTGPVCRHADIKEEVNIVGGGINTAQRVMDCGDAGHILLSRTVAEVLEQFGGWRECLQDLGLQEVKHSVRVHLYNLCKDGVGNPEIPRRIMADAKASQSTEAAMVKPPGRSRRKWLVAGSIAALLAGGAFIFRQEIRFFWSGAAVPKPSPAESRVSPSAAAAAIHPDAMSVINEWAASMRAMDLQRHLALYADSLETFYAKRSVPKADVAREIQGMFARYSSFPDFQMSKWSSRELQPGRLTVEFDKKYKAVYKTGFPNEGIVRSQLVLQRFEDRWKIVSESDTKVYWTSKSEPSAEAKLAPQQGPLDAPGPSTSPSPPIDVLNETAIFRDPDSYIEFRYPSRVFRLENAQDRNEVIRLKSDEGVIISVSIVATDRDDALRSAYRLELETPGRQIHYKTGIQNGWYVVSGFEGSILFYRRVVSSRNHIASMTIFHNKDVKPSFNPAVVIAQTFRAIDGTR